MDVGRNYSKDNLIRDWRSVMDYPSDKQKDAVRGNKRSPYIVFYPMFKGIEGITEYSINFQIDDMDDGTYFSTLNANLDISALTKKYASVTNDFYTPGGFYCGVQRWENGRTGVIMSIWDNICKDKNGRQTIVCANQLYPECKAGTSKTSSEGRFQQFLQEYPIKTRTPYRILIHMNQSKTNGNTELTMWICDLAAYQWKKLVSWNLGYESRYIKTQSLAGFMENYNPYYSGSVRNVSFLNIRGRNYKNRKWVASKTVIFTVNNSITDLGYKGSYNFGSDETTFWIITSGVEGLCHLPEIKPSAQKLLYIIDYLGVSPSLFFDEDEANPVLAQKIIDGLKEMPEADLLLLISFINRMKEGKA